MSERGSGQVGRLFEPVWAGGWAATRVLFAFAALLAHAPRILGIGDAYGAPDLYITNGWYRLNDLVHMTPTTAYVMWALGLWGLVLVALGGKTFRVGLVLWLVGAGALLLDEALNVKAYDRLLWWVSLAMLVSPAGERGLTGKYRSPIGRYVLLIVYSSIYGSTGMFKLLYESGWWTGDTLNHHLVHQWHAGSWLATLISGQSWLTAPMGWWTVLFEVSFPFLIWFKRTNPVILVLAFCFHMGLLALMQVGPFGFVSIAAYPVLLHPEVAREAWERAGRWWSDRTAGAGAA